MKILSKIMMLSALGLLVVACGNNPERTKAGDEKITGSVQRAVGSATGDESMKSEGRANETKGDLRSTKEDIKDIVKGD